MSNQTPHAASQIRRVWAVQGHPLGRRRFSPSSQTTFPPFVTVNCHLWDTAVRLSKVLWHTRDGAKYETSPLPEKTRHNRKKQNRTTKRSRVAWLLRGWCLVSSLQPPSTDSPSASPHSLTLLHLFPVFPKKAAVFSPPWVNAVRI